MHDECLKEKEWGKMEEFVESLKNVHRTFGAVAITVAFAIILQVGAFLFLWGSLTTTVKSNTEYLWRDVAPKTLENTRNIDKILAKFDRDIAHAGEK